jgi:hypothetical protein
MNYLRRHDVPPSVAALRARRGRRRRYREAAQAAALEESLEREIEEELVRLAMEAEERRFIRDAVTVNATLRRIEQRRYLSRSFILPPLLAVGICCAAIFALRYFQANPVALHWATMLGVVIPAAIFGAAAVLYDWLIEVVGPLWEREAEKRRAEADRDLLESQAALFSAGKYKLVDYGYGAESYYKVDYSAFLR